MTTLTAPAVFFHTAGYLRAPALLSAAEVAQLRDAAYRIAERKDHEHVTHTPEKVRIDHVVSLVPTFLELATSDRLLEPLQRVLGSISS